MLGTIKFKFNLKDGCPKYLSIKMQDKISIEEVFNIAQNNINFVNILHVSITQQLLSRFC